MTKPTLSDPVVLVLDGHYSHSRNIEVIDLAKKNHVSLVCLPPHTTHRMQPLDVGFNFPLKTYYAREIETYLRNNPGQVVTVSLVMRLFATAYSKAATMENSMNAFRKTGLFPCNRYIFDAELGSGLETEVEATPRAASPSPSSNLPVIPGPSGVKMKPTTPGAASSSPSCSFPVIPGPSGVMVKPSDISPVPSRPSASSSSRSSSAALLTASPYKQQLEEKAQAKQQKEQKKAKRRLHLTKGKKPKKANKKSTKAKKKRQESSEDETCDDEEPPLQESDGSDFNYGDSDPECMLCSSRFSEDTKGEKWARCVLCSRWSHEDCGEFQNKAFFCSVCHS